MCNGPTSTTSNADAPRTTPANHPNAHRASLHAPPDSIEDPPFRIAAALASKRLRRRVLHQCSHLGTDTGGRMQFDRCCLVIRMQKMKPLAPNFNCYVECIDCP